ncbi:hypothetical protein [Nitrosomonas sp.]|uniref:hypothetical protein n=1 Tax=Nitrosomonas sp. TaxID=42353 RepID=UPI001DB5A455|nr:hypothetical protein [Nitrosomonas sp.]MCB1947490.1 hypothetical protein [Nitrosomonas sp.]
MKRAVTVFMISFFMSNSVLSQLIDDIKGDMLLNEVKLLQAPNSAGWAKQARIDFGAAPRGDNSPQWWQPENPVYKSSDYWNAIIPWFVVYPGESHAATNVRVIVSDINLYILKKSTNQWVRVNSATNPNGQKHQLHISPSTASDSVDVRVEPSGEMSYKLNSAMNPIHGWISPKLAIDGADIKAVYATMKTRLILDNPNGTDDTAHAQLAASVGVDYYPAIDSVLSDFHPETYVPAAGFSKFSLIKTTTRTHYFATIDPPGPNQTGAKYAERNRFTTISITDFLSNPPPGVW